MKISKKLTFIFLGAILMVAFWAIFANAISKPEIITDRAGSITTDSATLFGKITFNNSSMVDFWFEYWPQDNSSSKQTTQKRTNFNSNITASRPYSFAQNINILDSGKVYCFRAVAQNSQGYGYGEEQCFTTANSGNISAPIVKTLSPTVYSNSATLRGEIEKLGNPTTAGVSFEWYRQKTQWAKKTTPVRYFQIAQEFSESINDLIPGDFYCYKTKTTYLANIPVSYSGHNGYYMPYPYACSGNQCNGVPQPNTYYQTGTVYTSGGPQNYTIYGEEKCFIAGNGNNNDDDDDDNNGSDKPSIGNVYSDNIGDDYATLHARLNDLGDDSNANIWFEYGKTTSYGYQTSKINTSNTGYFTKNIYNLDNNSTYHFRAIAQNKNGVVYSSDYTFTTNNNNSNNQEKPEISTKSATNIDDDRATLNANLYDLGDDNNVDIWFEYNDNGYTSLIPVVLADNGITNTITRSNTGDLSISVNGLRNNRTYNFRAVARNDYGTSFGNWKTFRTDGNNNDDDNTRPDVSTRSATNIGYRYATLKGYLNDLGDDNDANVWFEYGRTTSYGNETDREYRTSTGEMQSYINDLQEDVVYHFRAVAQNRNGTRYGNDYTFTTNGDNNDDHNDNNDEPYVITKSASNVSDYGARLNGFLDDLGRDNEAQVWFEYGTNKNSLDKTSKIWKSQEESFSTYVNDLENDRTYYFRAVAQNDYGKHYGNYLTFTTGDNYYDNGDDDDNYGTMFRNKELSIDIRTKNQSQYGQYWSEITNAKPLDLITFRIDIRNNKNSTANNVYVKTALSPNIQIIGNISIDGRISNGDILNGINIGSISSKQVKTITFSAQVKDSYNFAYGQNDLVSVAYIKNSDPKILESCKVVVLRTSVSGISYNPSSIITGVGENFLTYVFLPLILAVITIVLFKKKIMAFFSKWDKSVFKAENRSSERELEKKIKEIGQ